MKNTLSTLAIAATLAATFAGSALAQSAQVPVGAGDYYAVAPSTQIDPSEARSFNLQRDRSSNAFTSQDAQRVRGDRW